MSDGRAVHRERTLRAALWGASGFAAGYLLPCAALLPVLAYDPLRRTAQVTFVPSSAQMRYPGDLLWACAAALGAAGLSRVLGGDRPFDARIPAASALSLYALDVAVHLSRLLAAV